MPRTTIDLDPSVLGELRRRSRLEGKSMGRVASEVLAQALAESTSSGRVQPFRWITRPMGKPLVDLEDKEAVRRLLDSE